MIPWSSVDNCMNWTWYLANDMQFFLLVPPLVTLYYRKRKYFNFTISCLFIACTVIQLCIILANKLSVSYFTYKDEYWSIYYVKPYARLPVYLIGILFGCSYYSYKSEHPEA